MSYRGLRIFSASTTLQADSATMPHTVTVPVGDVLPLLAEAVHTQKAWVNDFLDDEITISTDLYEVLLAFEHYRRTAG